MTADGFVERGAVEEREGEAYRCRSSVDDESLRFDRMPVGRKHGCTQVN